MLIATIPTNTGSYFPNTALSPDRNVANMKKYMNVRNTTSGIPNITSLYIFAKFLINESNIKLENVLVNK